MKNVFSRYKVNILVFCLYILLAVILTYPVIYVIGLSIPGYLDAFQWMYYLWYNHGLVFLHQTSTLGHSTLLFWPTGTPIIAFSSAFNQILSVILLSLISLPAVYTFLWFSTFVIGAFGAYLLVEYLTRNHIAAFIAGLAFAFSPFHFAHAQGHLGATTIQWIPFCALFFMKMYQEKNFKYSIIAGLFFILVGMSDLQYLVFMGIFVVLIFLFEVCTRCIGKRPDSLENFTNILKKYILFGLVAVIGILPLTIGEIIVATSATNYLKTGPLEATLYSADIFSFFIPSSLHTVFGLVTGPIYQNFTGNIWENTTYIGYTILLLSLFAVLKLRRQILVKFWLITAILFSIFSLGPILHVNGTTIFTVFNTNTTVPLPYMILSTVIPFLENSRTPGRFFVIATLAFAVLAGYGIAELLNSKNSRKYLLSILLCGLIIFEFLSVPYIISRVDQPTFYKNISSDNDMYALLEIPASLNYTAGVKIEYYQTIHGKPIVGGQIARMPVSARDFEGNTPFIRELTFAEKPQNDIINQNLSSIGNSVLQYYNIRYVVIHKDFLTKEQLEKLQKILGRCIPHLPKIYEDDMLVVYAQNRTEPINQFISLGSGWQGLENWTGVPTRWMINNANILVYSDNTQDTRLNFMAISFAKVRNISIVVNNQSVRSYEIGSKFINVSEPIRISKGMNSLSIVNLEGCERPSDTPSYNNTDSRCLGIAIQNISLQ